MKPFTGVIDTETAVFCSEGKSILGYSRRKKKKAIASNIPNLLKEINVQ